MVADRLKKARIDAGMTQGELAEKLDTHATVISRYESGRNQPTIGALYRVAKATGVDVAWIVSEETEEESVTVPKSWWSKLCNLYRGMAVMNPNAEQMPECLSKLTQNQRGHVLIDTTTVLTDLAVAHDGTTISEQITSFDPLAFAKRLFKPA